jgi:pyruvate kinase
MPKTKIVCTIGPASSSPDVLQQLLRAGMNVARLNFSHGTQAEHGRVMADLRRSSKELDRPLAILQDLAGPKIRIGKLKSGPIQLESQCRFTLTGRDVPGDQNEVSVTYPNLAEEVQPGDTLLLADGSLELKVIETTQDDIKCCVIVGGTLSSHKGINLPTRSLKVPSLTEKDKADLAFGIQQRVDYVALSFVRSAADVLEARHFIQERGASVPIIAKIEKHEALDNIDEIIEVVDGIMVARGDLGVETPLETVPLVQKMVIKKSNRAGKPVITATQMLRSMVENPRPTRAEVSDVANAILDGTDAVMLSEETAAGKYPVQAVEMMAKIAEDAESGFPYDLWMTRVHRKCLKTMPEAVGIAACNLADDIEADAIITCTQSGGTARLISKYRPQQLVLAATPVEDTYRRLALIWGVSPFLIEGVGNTDEMMDKVFSTALNAGLVQSGHKVVITAGVPVGISGTTNLIKAEVLK